MKKTKLIISICINLLITALVVMSTVFMMTGYRFMAGSDLILTGDKAQALKFFTVDSNLLMGAIALLFVVFEILLILGKTDKLPKWLYIVKHMGTVGVVLTFITTACFLAPFLVDDYWLLFKNSNLFFHAIIPILSLITWVVLEDVDEIEWKYSFIGMIPMVIYAVFYCIVALTHVENGAVPAEYDWYGFLRGGIAFAGVALPVMLIGTYAIAFLLWLGNKGFYKLYNRNEPIEQEGTGEVVPDETEIQE